MIYSNFSKPTLDIILFSRKLSELVGWQGPLAVVIWYLFSGVIIKWVSPAFGKMTAVEQRMEGEYRAAQTGVVHHSEEIAFYKGNDWEKMRINSLFNVTNGPFRNSSLTAKASSTKNYLWVCSTPCWSSTGQ